MTDNQVSRRLRSVAETRGRGATFEEITRAELRLGVVLSDSYRAFLREFGWGGMAGWEIYGLGPDVPFHLDLVGVTKSERTQATPRLPHHLVPLMNDGSGSHYCLDTWRRSHHRESPVVFWNIELDESQAPEEVEEDFHTWLHRLIIRSSRR